MKIAREMVRSTSMGIDAIDRLLPYTENEALTNVMREQKEDMAQMLTEAKRGLSGDEIAQAEGGKLSKTVLKASAMMSAMMNNDPSNLARKLIEGYETGIVSLQKCINEMQKEHDEVPVLAKDLVKCYDKNIRALRKFL